MTNKPILYLEKDLFTEDERQDTVAIISQYFTVREIDLLGVVQSRINPKNVLYGRFSLNIAKYLKRNFQYADCLNWLPVLREYIISPSQTSFNDMDYFLNHTTDENFPLFLRPCNGFKSFSGQVFPNKGKLIEEGNFMRNNKNIDTSLMCMTAPVVDIAMEWRTIFVEGQYCSGSQYMVKEELNLSPDVPDDVVDFANKIASHPFFANIGNYCIDICQVNDKLHLLEVNSFDCSSFYAADLDKIYKTWSTYYES